MSFIGNRYELINCEEYLEFNKNYKARDAYNNDNVLIKIIEHNEYICESFLSNLIDESTMHEHINSPYINKIIDVGMHCTDYQTLYYIVSEYSEGIPLEDVIKGKYLHLEAIVNIATQIVKSLETINSYNMYHGDLSPSNIIVDKHYNVKVCNLGVTKANNGINVRSSRSIGYLSPHQLCINYTDIESDFFTLGLILFESIFKRLPFEQFDTEEMMLKSIDKGINWNELKAINGNIALINIIKKLLSRSEKYEDIKDIIIDLSLVMYDKAEIEEVVEEETKEEEFNLSYDVGVIAIKDTSNIRSRAFVAMTMIVFLLIVVMIIL